MMKWRNIALDFFVPVLRRFVVHSGAMCDKLVWVQERKKTGKRQAPSKMRQGSVDGTLF